MTTFPNSPKLLKGGIVMIDPTTSAVQRIIALQYNPDTLSRTLQPQAIKEGGDRSEAMRLTGPPVETIKVEAEINVTDQLDQSSPLATTSGTLSHVRHTIFQEQASSFKKQPSNQNDHPPIGGNL